MLVWLLGGASTGKSSIARRILGRAERGEAWILTGDEHVTSRIPRRLITPRASEAEPPSDGWDILVVDRQLQRLPRVGPVGMRILDAMYRGAAAMAEAGAHVVLEDVIWEPQVCDLALRALGDSPRLVVELSCDPEVRLERERTRGDRYVGAVARRSWRVRSCRSWPISGSTRPIGARATAPTRSSRSSARGPCARPLT